MTVTRILVLVASIVSASAANARDILLLTGAEVGAADSSYVFFGAVTPLQGQHLGNGWHGRLWLDHIRYSYDSGADTVRANSPGGHLAAGYQNSTDSGGWSLFAGYSYHDTNLDPDQPGAAARGAQSSLLVQGELNQRAGAVVRFSEMAMYEFAPESWWVRVKAGYSPSENGLSHGIHVDALGGPDYDIYKLGYSADGFNLGAGLRGNIGFGYGTNPGVEDFPFVTLELVWLLQ